MLSTIKDRNIMVILQHDNAKPNVTKIIQETLQVLTWEILPHPPYLPDIAPSNYHLFWSMHSALLEEHFSYCEEFTKWVNQWIAFKEPDFYYREIHLLPEKWENVVPFNGKYFRWNIFYFIISIYASLFIKKMLRT